jgi:hypothetical protein
MQRGTTAADSFDYPQKSALLPLNHTGVAAHAVACFGLFSIGVT